MRRSRSRLATSGLKAPAVTLPEFSFVASAYDTLRGGSTPSLLARVSGELLVPLLLMSVRLAARRGKPLRHIVSRRQQQALSRLAEADVVVYTGGTSLVGNYDLRGKLFDLQLAQELGVPVIFFTQSMGPFVKPGLRRKLGNILRKSPLILLRDQASLANAVAVGAPPERCHVLADVVFGLHSSQNVTRRSAWPPQKVAISVRDWAHFEKIDTVEGMRRYRESVANLVNFVVRELGAKVSFLSTCQGRPEYWTDDSLVAEEIAKALPQDVRESVVVDRLPRSPDQLRDAFGGFDLVVATRMHAAILALIAGTPVLPIAYEFKTVELFRTLGWGPLISHIDELANDTLVGKLQLLLTQTHLLGETLHAAVVAQVADARTAVSLLRAAGL